jgi:hypothetical protein
METDLEKVCILCECACTEEHETMNGKVTIHGECLKIVEPILLLLYNFYSQVLQLSLQSAKTLEQKV